MADIRCVACFADAILNSVSNVCGAGARFSDVPVTFWGPKSNIQIEIERIRARVLARKLLHFFH